jgi:hypothetical protein
MVTPLTRTLAKEFFKSLALGSVAGYGFYKYQENIYKLSLHGLYIKLLNRRKG